MTRLRSLLAVCAFALPIPAAVAGCGGDDSGDADPQTVIDETFSTEERASSGDLALTVSASAEGAAGGSFEAGLSGPFQGDVDDQKAIPQLDWTGSISVDGAGQSFSAEGGLVVTEENAFVEYGGEAYEVGTETFSQFRELAESAAAQQTEDPEGLSIGEAFRQQCESQLEAQGGDPSACEIDFQSWLTDLTNEGTEDIEGTEADHISGSLDLEAMLQDLIELGGSVQGSTAPSEEEIQQVVDAVEEASFDLYSGTEDRILRGLDFNFSLDGSQIEDAEASGVETVDASFSLRLGAVNEDQTIDAPGDAQPIENLLGEFGIDPSALGGLGALGGGGLGVTPGQSGGGAGAGAGAPGGGDTDAYLDCIAEAATPEDINACSQEL